MEIAPGTVSGECRVCCGSWCQKNDLPQKLAQSCMLRMQYHWVWSEGELFDALVEEGAYSEARTACSRCYSHSMLQLQA